MEDEAAADDMLEVVVSEAVADAEEAIISLSGRTIMMPLDEMNG